MSIFNKNKTAPAEIELLPTSNEIKGQFKEFIWETLKVIVISLAIIIPIRYFLIQPFYVKGASMEPNFYDHEYLIIDEISYRLNKPARGDVIVFRYPNDPSQYFIKRIIGLPNETIKISGGKITIINGENLNGFILDEKNYLPESYTQGSVDLTLSENEYYLLGDNRSSSLDSRVFGPINGSAIIGRTWLRGWPLSRAVIFNQATY